MSAKYEIRKAANEAGWYFVLKADNGEIVATSETYTQKASAEEGVRDAAKASVEAAANKLFEGDEGE